MLISYTKQSVLLMCNRKQIGNGWQQNAVLFNYTKLNQERGEGATIKYTLTTVYQSKINCQDDDSGSVHTAGWRQCLEWQDYQSVCPPPQTPHCGGFLKVCESCHE